MGQDSNILVLRTVSPLTVSEKAMTRVRKPLVDKIYLQSINHFQAIVYNIALPAWAIERSTQGENVFHKYGKVSGRWTWSKYSLTVSVKRNHLALGDSKLHAEVDQLRPLDFDTLQQKSTRALCGYAYSGS